MTKTERLYYSDPYLREFDARVLHAAPDPQGFRLYLDRSAFYPGSGGRPADNRRDTPAISATLPSWVEASQFLPL